MKDKGQNDITNPERMSEEEGSAILTDDDLDLSLGLGLMSSSSSSSSVPKNNVTADGHAKSTSNLDLNIKPLMFKRIKKTTVRSINFFGVTIHTSDTVVEHVPVYNPTPLRTFPSSTTTEDNIIQESDDQQDNVDTILRLSIAPPPPPVATNNNDPLPLDNFSRTLHRIESQLGSTKPIFLCSKRLTKSDVSGNLNRLFITQSEKLMGFLSDEERRTVEDIDQKIWLEVYAIDALGESYKLHMSRWKSLKVVVVNGSGWKKLISANRVEKDNLIELWGYRENSKFHLAVNFKQLDPVAETSNGNNGLKQD